MKKFSFEKETSPFICNLIFSIYLKIFLKKWNKLDVSYNKVYDNYGIIDTLGNSLEIGKFTYAYSDELVSIYGIKFCGIEFECIN